MGAGASIPTSEAAAKEAGYTDEQIAEYKAKQEETGAVAEAEAGAAEAVEAKAEPTEEAKEDKEEGGAAGADAAVEGEAMASEDVKINPSSVQVRGTVLLVCVLF